MKKIILSLCLFVTQLLLLSPAQASNGYTSWNDYVSKKQHCNGNNIICSNFADGQKIYSIGYNECVENECISIKYYVRYGNDPYSLLQIASKAADNYYKIKENTGQTYTPKEMNEYGLLYDINRVSKTGNVYMGTGYVGIVDIQICSGFVDGYGCPNTDNNDSLDRTKLEDGPCDICSKEGNPFDVRNGSKTESMLDIDFPISFQRTYNSKLKNQGTIGYNWRSNFDKKVKITKNSNGIITTLGFLTPDDNEIIFTSTNGTTFNAIYNDNSQYKVSIANGYILLLKPDTSVEYYSTTGLIMSEKYKGRVLTYEYNGNILQKVTDSLGRYLQFNYNSANYISQITSSNGDTLKYEYNDANLTTIKMNGINQISYEYSGANIIGKLNAEGIKYASFTYDESGRGIENKWLTDDGHDIKKYTFSYGVNETTVTQDNGNTKTYKISTMNYQKKVSTLNWNGFTEETSFDNNGNVTNKKDFNNVYENYTYDTAGRILTLYRDGKNTSMNWDSSNNVLNYITENSPNGTRTTNYIYDTNYNVLKKSITTSNEVMTWNYTYTTDGRVLTKTDPNGLITTYTYKPNNTTVISGLLHSITTNSGQSMVVNSYDTRGNPTSITANGVTKTMSYDYKGRVLSETTNNNGNNITNNYTYDSNGNLLTSQMADGYILTMIYDSAGRMLSISDNMGGSSTFNYDDNTNEVLTTEILQNNTLVRAKNKIIDSLGRTTEMWNATTKTKKLTSYNNYIDKPNSTTDSNDKQSTYSWNSRGNMTNFNGGGDTSNKNYDIDGNQTRITVNNQQTTMNYDDFGRITQLNSADTGNHTYVHNTATRKVTHTDAKGIVHSATSDLNGNPIAITHTSGSNIQTESYGYNTKGELTSFNDNSGNTMYIRNSIGQITSKTQTMNGKVFNVQYGYNDIGQKITDTYPSGMVVNYTYTNGFLNEITVNNNKIVSNVEYNTMLKEPFSWNLGDNVVSVIKDSDGLLTGFMESGIFNQNITTDNEGNITAVNDNVSNNNFNVILTDNYALKSGNINGKNLNYMFAYNNNLNSQNDGVTNYGFYPTYSNNKTDSITNNAIYNTIYYQYDNNGNTTLDNKGSYTYDLKNNMMSSNRTINGNNATGTYSFNALGHRVVKNVSGQVKYFAYNENNQVIGEYDNNGNVINEYVYFGLRPVAVRTGVNINIVHTDYLGSPRIITSGTNGGSTVWEWKNDNPYGNNKATGSIEFNLRFAGQYYDSELHYNINRTYDPEVGRYMQSDPIGLSGGSNTYNYVNRNPLSNVDPLGLDKISYLKTPDMNQPAAWMANNWSNTLRVTTHTNELGAFNNRGNIIYNKDIANLLYETDYVLNRLKHNLPVILILDSCNAAQEGSDLIRNLNTNLVSIIRKNGFNSVPIYIVGATHEVRSLIGNFETQWSFKSEFPYIETGKWKVYKNGIYDPSLDTYANPNRQDFNPTRGVVSTKLK